MKKGDNKMKKMYIKPEIEEMISEDLMQQKPILASVGKTGSVPNEDDTDWRFGGDGSETDNPDAKGGNLWDGWDD